jgi:uncharacterized protein (DUF58 family)
VIDGPLFTAADLKRLDRLALLTRKAVRGEGPGERKSRRMGTGGQFADYRNYVVGDDFRYVDWNVYGRHGDLVVKRFESEENVNLLLCVDRSPSMEGGKALEARRFAGALAHVALRHRDAVTLAWLPSVPGGAPVEAFRGPKRIDELLATLAKTPAAGPTRHVEDLEVVLAALRRTGPAMLISDFFDPAGAVGGLRLLKAHRFEVTAVHVSDVGDVALPVGEAIRCVDRETGESLELDATPGLVASVHAAWRRRAERLSAWCAAREIVCQRVDVGRPFWDVLRDLVRSGVVAAT